jgi:hypothetical protein
VPSHFDTLDVAWDAVRRIREAMKANSE